MVCKDTPNFIANRIGTFGLQHVLLVMQEDGYTIDEVDQLTGPAIGRPKSATFPDVGHCGPRHLCACDAEHLPECSTTTSSANYSRCLSFIEAHAGERISWAIRAGKASTRRPGKGEIQALNLSSMEYGPRTKGKFPSLEMGKSITDLSERLRALTNATDRAGSFLWKTLSASAGLFGQPGSRDFRRHRERRQRHEVGFQLGTGTF